MPDNDLPKGHNPFDKFTKEFIKRYKYELLASFALLSLLGGIVLAVKVVDGRKTKVEVVPTESQAGAAQDKKLVVEVSGEVVKPGVYELDSGSRVNDLIKTAGDLTNKADSVWVEKNLNRAEVLTDGQKVYIPAEGEVQAGGSTSGGVQGAVTTKVNLNTASQAQLESLPGIGPAYAQRIIAARPFKNVRQLLSVSGIGAKTYEQLKDLVTVY